MQKLNSGQEIKKRKATFSMHSEDAKEVFLVGNFNDWNPKKHPMHQKKNGTWTKTVMVPPGMYEYKFLVDGRWEEDSQNSVACLNCFGTRNSVLDLTRT
jgi:1,4-alpha-glucan branching enzyme